jgi:hypothetical protein
MDMEEAVARAICLAAYDNTDEWKEWLPEARAAIKAVESYRVPSPPTGPDQRPGIGQDREQG